MFPVTLGIVHHLAALLVGMIAVYGLLAVQGLYAFRERKRDRLAARRERDRQLTRR